MAGTHVFVENSSMWTGFLFVPRQKFLPCYCRATNHFLSGFLHEHKGIPYRSVDGVCPYNSYLQTKQYSRSIKSHLIKSYLRCEMKICH